MLGLFMLAPPLEYKWGSQRFLTFYMVTGVGAALLYSGVHAIEYARLMDVLDPDAIAQIKNDGYAILKSHRNYSDADWGSLNGLFFGSMVGASGAIYGVLLAFGMTFPNTELIMFPLPIPIKAKYFVLILGGISIYNTLQANPDDNVAHLAHLGGMIVGFILIRLWRTRGGGGQFGWDR